MGAVDRRGWFELSDAGWRARARARPLGYLLLEALQNAFDEQAEEVSVALGPEQVIIEDDAPSGFEDERLVYTVFLSSKHAQGDRRGRLGRGLKELIASMERAEVQTVGTSIVFDGDGRARQSNERTRGTRVVLERSFSREELDQAGTLLRSVIPPRAVSLRVDGCVIRAPTLVLTLAERELPTVRVQGGREQSVLGVTTLSVYTPRRGETPQIYEMGIPVEIWDVPWHVDVGQRVPVREGREQLPEPFKLQLKGTLLEAMIHRYMEPRDLRADWVHEAVAHWPVKGSVLHAYVSKVFPRGAVLASHTHFDDRAAQLGAHVIEATGMPQGTFRALGRVLESSEAYTLRREVELGGEYVEPDDTMERFAHAVRYAARELTGMRVQVSFFAREPTDHGLIEDAITDVDERRLRFNVKAGLRFDDLLDPRTFGVVLHELAHLDHALHDLRFIDRLQLLSGHAARWLASQGPEFARALRQGAV